MSDFVNEFWNWYIILIVLISIVACGVFLWSQSARASESKSVDSTTGHVWDETLQEYNNPLPRWWMWLFYLTVAFALVYVALYPALGRFPGLKGWTSAGEHQAEVDAANAKLKPLLDKYMSMDLVALSKDKDAMEMGSRLFQTYCIQCHGATAEGVPGKGFPNLTDKDWQWGGSPEQILETISNGRMGNMPPYGGNPDAVGGEAGAKEIANYVRSLSGYAHDTALAAKGEARFKEVCIACHGPDGKGMYALGAPNLTDKIWLYGSSEAKIIETITQGRTNLMPAWKDFLGEGKVHLLAAYVISLGGATLEPATPAAATAGDEGPMSLLDGNTAKFYFATGKSDLSADAATVVTGFAALVNAKPDAKISISGFHDATGNKAANEELAKERAKHVAEALKAAGVPEANLKLDKPTETTGSGENKEARRVEATLL